MLHRTATILLRLLAATILPAQTLVEGRVTATDGEAIADAVVKVAQGGRTLAFATTKADGRYSMETTAMGELTLTARHLSYETDTTAIRADGTRRICDIVLASKTRQMEEIKVKAPAVQATGDTLKYTLAQFTTKSDVTLENALRHIPGIEVDKDGAISYMGQGISNFYIEGMDMLGGRYNLATRGMRADYATTVEVLTNHHDRKIDRDEESEKVALNIRLSKKAKFRPIGQSEAGVGCRDGDGIYRLGLTGMLFSTKFQMLVSGKADNHTDVGTETTDHLDGAARSIAEKVMPTICASQSPQGESRHNSSAFATANILIRLNSCAQLRVNVGYNYLRHNSRMERNSLYSLGDSISVVDETADTRASAHMPSATIRYTADKADFYICNNTRIDAAFQSDECPVAIDASTYAQTRDARSLSAKNSLIAIRRLGANKMRLLSDISFVRSPGITMRLGEAAQRAQSTSLATTHRTIFTIPMGRGWRLSLPVALRLDYDFVESRRDIGDSRNHLSSWTLQPRLSPGTNWQSRDGRLFVEAHVGVSVIAMWMRSHQDGMRSSFVRALLEPSLHLRYRFSNLNELHLRSQFNNQTVDISDMMTSPISTSFRSETMASGVMAHNEVWRTQLSVRLTRPLQFFSVSADIAYKLTWCNMLPSSFVSGKEVTESLLASDSHGQSLIASMSASKNILPIYAKLHGTLSYAWSNHEMMSQAKRTDIQSHALMLRAGAESSPTGWLELSYDFSLSHEHTDYGNQTLLQHKAALNLLPVSSLSVGATLHHNETLSSSPYKGRFTLLDCQAQLKLKRAVIRLSVQNVLDKRHYTYAVFAGPYRYTYDYNLCGRTYMATVTLTH